MSAQHLCAEPARIVTQQGISRRERARDLVEDVMRPTRDLGRELPDVRLEDVGSEGPVFAGGSPAVRGYLAVPVISRTGDVLAGLFFGHGEVGHFSEHHERLMLGLRTRDGIKLDRADADLSPVDACLEELAGAGLVDAGDDGATLTRRGRLLANDVAARLLAALDASLDDRAAAPVGTR